MNKTPIGTTTPTPIFVPVASPLLALLTADVESPAAPLVAELFEDVVVLGATTKVNINELFSVEKKLTRRTILKSIAFCCYGVLIRTA